MPYTTKKLPQSQVEFVITVKPGEYQKHLDLAADRISTRTAIKGFRKGKAPYDLVKQQVGEMAILQEALESVVKESFYTAIMEEKLETIGMPEINVEKMAPGNDIEYKAIVALMPNVELPNLDSIDVKHKEAKVDDKKVTETLDAVRGMHATETIKSGAAEGTDKLVLDMDMFLDKVPVEGGQAKSHQVYLSEKHYIPGFNEHVVGLKKDEEKEFSLEFPKEHFQKHLAGKKVDFKVKVKEVYERQLPELSDDLAKKLGQESVEKLKEIVHSNLLSEARQKAAQKVEIEILNQLIEKSKIDEIPEVLVNAERQKIFHELQRALERAGVPIQKYLEDLKKTEEDLFNDFKEQATKRAQTALISRQVALDNEIVVTDEETEAEMNMMKEMYKDNEEYMENLKRPEVKDSIATAMQNKKVMKFLKAKITGETLMEDKDLADMGCKDCKDGHKHEHHDQEDKEETK